MSSDASTSEDAHHMQSRPYHSAPLDLDSLFAATRPQLVQLAQAMGHAPDVAEDIVQETLLEAITHLDRLVSPNGLTLWLKAICRNVGRRYTQERKNQWRHHVDLPDEDLLPVRLADDPFETLDQPDLMQVVEHALGHLSAPARSVVEQCYLEGRPQREVAEQWGVTIKALEARLVRARRQLREVLAGALREEAEAFDLVPTAEPSWGWRETREWCHRCGRHRLRGCFEAMPDGRINLRLRCPECSLHNDVDMTSSGGVIPLGDLHAFAPALKRFRRLTYPYYDAGIKSGEHPCMACGRPVTVRIVAAEEAPVHLRRQTYYVCEQCSCSYDAYVCANSLVRDVHPELTRFAHEHPRWVHEPDQMTEYQGQAALRFSMVDRAHAARCITFAHPQTLAVLAVHTEDTRGVPSL